jgi:hypothetical protein
VYKLKNLPSVLPAYAHEFFHWIAAQAFGLRAQIVVDPEAKLAYTEVYEGSGSQN